MCVVKGSVCDGKVEILIRSDCAQRKLAPKFGSKSEYAGEIDVFDDEM